MSKKEEKKHTSPEMDMNTNPIWNILKGGEVPKKKQEKEKIEESTILTMDEEIDQFFSELEKTTVVKTDEKVKPRKRKPKFSWFQLIIGLSIFVIAVFTGLILYKYDRLTVTSSTMTGTINEKNKVLYQENLPVRRFNVVVVEKNGEKDIFRVIGMPGDSVKMIDDILTINNAEYDEIYLKRNYLDFKSQDNNLKENYTTNFDLIEIDKEKSEIQNIPTSQYLLLGDNRTESMDSRQIGFYDAAEIKGVVLMKIWPFSEFGPIE